MQSFMGLPAAAKGVGSKSRRGEKETFWKFAFCNCVGAKQQEGIGLGLLNTRARLKHLYSDEASFSFHPDSVGSAVATLVLPAIRSQSQAEKAPGPHAQIGDGRN